MKIIIINKIKTKVSQNVYYFFFQCNKNRQIYKEIKNNKILVKCKNNILLPTIFSSIIWDSVEHKV